MMAAGRLELEALISHRFDIGQAERAYAVVGGSEPSLGIVLRYPEPAADDAATRQRVVALPAAAAPGLDGAPRISVIGAGNYAGAVLIPALKAGGARLMQIASAGGASSVHLGRKFGFAQATTDADALIADSDCDVVVISTRHDSHAHYVVRALEAGKHVFVEKPLALTLAELQRIEAVARRAPRQLLMVGFNRRFAPQVQRMAALLQGAPGPKALVMTVNAGAIPAAHWAQDRAVGGGRLLGEGCHFVDLLRFLAGTAIESHQVTAMAGPTRDSASITLRFADGSIGTIHYLANGSKAFAKERLEVFAAGRVLQLDNFRRLRGFGWPGFSSMNLWRQDKGQTACAAAFLQAVQQAGASPIALGELLEVGRASIEIEESLQ
jgi:predicted dehydrogenase